MSKGPGANRWLVDISTWNPTVQDLLLAISLLPEQEHFSITRYARIDDRKRALVSRLLQYAIVHETFKIPFDQIVIKRTVEGTPYLEYDRGCVKKLSNFNFSTSHHVDYVAIASEPLCLVGLDIVSNEVPKGKSVPEFIKNFSSYFSVLEWGEIYNSPTHDDMLENFYRLWCLKEAFVKALGVGMGFQLDNVEFHHTNWTNISARLGGNELTSWRFWIIDLGKGHLASVAKCYSVGHDLLEYGMAHSSPIEFQMKTVEGIIQMFQEKPGALE